MSSESVRLAYATPASTPLSAPIRWTLFAWSALVLTRHALYWFKEGIEMWNWKGSNIWTWFDVGPTMLALLAAMIAVAGLVLIITASLANSARAIRRLRIGAILVMIALLFSIGMVLFDWFDRWNWLALRVVIQRLWQIIAMLAAASPVLLAWLSAREQKNAMI